MKLTGFGGWADADCIPPNIRRYTIAAMTEQNTQKQNERRIMAAFRGRVDEVGEVSVADRRAEWKLIGQWEKDGEVEGFVAAGDGDQAVALPPERAADEPAEVFGVAGRRVVDGADDVTLGDAVGAERFVRLRAGDDQPLLVVDQREAHIGQLEELVRRG